MNLSLLSTTNRVEVPFIKVQIGDYTLGAYDKKDSRIVQDGKHYKFTKTTFPNYVESLSVKKINGALNVYTLTLKYAIRYGDDPNFIERVFSSVSKSRQIKFTYGDCAVPSFIYKEESAMITSVTSSIDVQNSCITYVVNATSNALNLRAQKRDFPRYVKRKPSDIIKEYLKDVTSGLSDIFYGMKDFGLVTAKKLIISDDREVTVERKTGMDILEYINYLVTCMSNESDSSNSLKKSDRYTLVISDEFDADLGGPYFKIVKVSSNITSINSLDTYEIDVGYPNTKNLVTGFRIIDDQTYSILYNYAQSIDSPQYVGRIDDEGDTYYEYSPSISTSNLLFKTTEIDKTWWSQMTQYPISAELTIKGLLRPSILMTYLKVNVLFYGKPHIATGTYMITQQVDSLSSSGYKTVLTLKRISQ